MTTNVFGNIFGGGGGSGDTDPPVITPISPTPDTDPGDPGGFSANRTIAAQTPVIIEIIDLDPGLEFVSVAARSYQSEDTELDHTTELAYRVDTFREPYTINSAEVGIADGIRLTILRDGNWTGRYLRLVVDAIDGNGNSATADLIYRLPAAAAVVVTEPVIDEDTGITNQVAAALDRLPWQFKGVAQDR